jgi:sec-independent protein translocase protein TatB
MFDVGFWEILLILVLALVVIGPERLPGAARRAGYLVGKARRFIEGARSEFESDFDVNELKRLLHNQEVQINELQQQLKSGVNDLNSELSTATSEVKQAVSSDPAQSDHPRDESAEDSQSSVADDKEKP